MVSKTIPVNAADKDLATFGGRLVAERERLRLKQVDVCVMVGVSKTTQIKYESNERRPDSDYLRILDHKGFDVMYLITGDRSSDALDPELQNLVEVYMAAPLVLKRAVFAALTSNLPYASSERAESARTVPGYFQYVLMGENDVRYERMRDAESKAKAEAGLRLAPEAEAPQQVGPFESELERKSPGTARVKKEQ